MPFKYYKNLNFFDKTILIANCLLSLSLLFSYLATTINPVDFPTIAILGFAYQFLFLVNLVFIIYWLIRLKIFVLLSLISILIGYNIILSNFGVNANAGIKLNKDTSNIRLMEYNVRGFYGIDSISEQPIQIPVYQLVDKIQPDIISFEEYVENRSKLDTTSTSNLFKTALKSKYFYFKPYSPVPKGAPNDSTGNAIFSKFPIINFGFINSPKILKVKAIFVDIKYKNKIIRVYSIHLAAVDIQENEKEQYLDGKISLDKIFFILRNLRAAFLVRSRQVDFIKMHINKCPYPYIIAGDFNDTPISYAVNYLGDGLKNAFMEKGTGLGTTYYNKFPKLQIDYIMVNSNFNVINYQILEKKLSDHKPIFSDLKYDNNQLHDSN